MDLLSTPAIVQFASQTLQSKNRDSLEYELIREALLRETQFKWQTVTKFLQRPPINPNTEMDVREDGNKADTEKRLTL